MVKSGTDLANARLRQQTELGVMKLIDAIRQMHKNRITQRNLRQIFAGDVIAVINNQTELLNHKFDQLLAGSDNQSDLMNRKFEQLLLGSDNQSDLINRKFEQLLEAIIDQSALLNNRLGQLVTEMTIHSDLLRLQLDVGDLQPPRSPRSEDATGQSSEPGVETEHAPANRFREARRNSPLLLAERTYNPCHPSYDAELVNNHPGKIFNYKDDCSNLAFGELARRAEHDMISDSSWSSILADCLAEASSISGAPEVFARQTYIENYMEVLNRRHGAHFEAEWANLDDALFLYWLVRQTNPRKIIQCGAGNGLSSSFMMLGLAKNGVEGSLTIIDPPSVSDPKNPEWTMQGKTSGACIPQGRTTAWMVPNAYRDRLEIRYRTAPDLLPNIIDNIDSVDMFYHESDITYESMMFECNEVKRKLAPGGLIVSDNISFNSSVWDFSGTSGVPAYNFKGAIGVAFF